MDNIEKRTYKITLLAIKCIPMLVALCYGLNTLLAFFTVHLDVFGILSQFTIYCLLLPSLLCFSFLCIPSDVYSLCSMHKYNKYI